MMKVRLGVDGGSRIVDHRIESEKEESLISRHLYQIKNVFDTIADRSKELNL